MRGIAVPDRTEDFTADPVELFFDLVFVFAFSRLVVHLVDTPTWNRVGEFSLLFLMIWLPWTQFTWSTNAVSSSSRPVRLLMLVATVASVPMAGSTTAAFDDGGPAFAISVSVILAMGLLTMITGLADEPDVRASIVRYSVPNWCAIALMIVGSFLEREVRIGFWITAIAIVVAGTIRAGSSEWLVRPGHFAERHGLIVIIAFGEVVVALGVPVAANLDDGGNLSAPTLAALVAAGTFAGLLWWGYFDRPSPAIEHRHTEHHDPIDAGRFARDVYTYIHTPIVAGVLVSAAALEQITQHPTEPLPSAFRWMLFSGLALYLLGVSLAVARAFRVVAVERTVATVVMGIAIASANDVDALVLIVIVDAILFAMLAIEHQRVEVKYREPVVGQQV